MNGHGAWLTGELDPWPGKLDLARLLEAGGLRVQLGEHSIRLPDFGHFVFQDFDGDRGYPEIRANADDVDSLVREATTLSTLLAERDHAHRFEVYDDEGEMAAYLHHRWPCVDLSSDDDA